MTETLLKTNVTKVERMAGSFRPLQYKGDNEIILGNTWKLQQKGYVSVKFVLFPQLYM